MKLNILASFNIYMANGAAKFVRLFENNKDYFKNNNIEIDIFSSCLNTISEQEYRETKEFRIKNFIKNKLKKTIIGSALSIYLTNIRSAKKVVRDIKAQIKDVDDINNVYLFNDLYSMKYFLKRYKHTCKCKKIYIAHNSGDLLKMNTINHPKLSKYYNSKMTIDNLMQMIKKMDKIIFVSDIAKLNFIKKYKDYQIDENKMEVIYIGGCIQVDRKLDCSHLNIVTVGSVCKRKNQFGIIKAIKELNDPTIHLTVVGDGDELEKCSNYVTENNLTKQVELVGSKLNVFDYLMKSNIFIMFSEDEGLPISAQEAMSCKLPLILTDVGGCKELISNNGILIKQDQQQLIEAIRWANNNKKELELMGENSKRIFDVNYSIETMIEKYVKLISKI